jgi:hypothetical protein
MDRVDLGAKLQLRPDQPVFVGDAPGDLELGLANRESELAEAGALIAFCHDSAALEQWRPALVAAVQRDALVWVAYPKAGNLGTDLNRDRLWKLLENEAVRPVRQIAIDEVWSALRFRPA